MNTVPKKRVALERYDEVIQRVVALRDQLALQETTESTALSPSAGTEGKTLVAALKLEQRRSQLLREALHEARSGEQPRQLDIAKEATERAPSTKPSPSRGDRREAEKAVMRELQQDLKAVAIHTSPDRSSPPAAKPKARRHGRAPRFNIEEDKSLLARLKADCALVAAGLE